MAGWRPAVRGMLRGILLLLLFGSMAAECSAAPEVQDVRIGYYTMNRFEDPSWMADMNGLLYRGYGYEYMLAVAQYAGWRCHFVHVNYADGIRMLQSGELDIMSRVERTAELEKIFSFTAAETRRRYQAADYFAVRKGNTELLRSMTAAMDALRLSDPSFTAALYEKYYSRGRGQALVLTPAEKDYILMHPVVRVVFDSTWFPISYEDADGHFAGALVRLYERIAKLTGLQFQFETADDFPGVLDRFERGEAELMAELPYDYLWAEKHQALLTLPFQRISLLMVYRPEQPKPHTIATPPGYYQQYLSENIRRDSYEFHTYATIDECLNSVLRGEMDGTLLNSYQLEYFRRSPQYRSLTFRVLPEMGYRLSSAVSREADPRLRSILMKALECLSPAEIDQMFLDAAQEEKPVLLSSLLYADPLHAAVCVLLVLSLAACGLLYRRNRQLYAGLQLQQAERRKKP